MTTALKIGPATAAFILSESDGNFSRDNAVLAKGAVDPIDGTAPVKTGTVLKAGGLLSLSTTGDTHTNDVLDNLASVAGLVAGETYFVNGTGIHSSFTYNGSNSAQTLDFATTATATGVALTITQGAPLVTSTNGDFHSSTTLDNIDDVTDLVPGQIYTVRAAVAELPNATAFSFEYPAPDPSGDQLIPATAVKLNVAASATAANVPIGIYRGTPPNDLTAWAASGDTVAGVLIYTTDPTAADVGVSIVSRDATLIGANLRYPPGLDVAVRAALATATLIVRD